MVKSRQHTTIMHFNQCICVITKATLRCTSIVADCFTDILIDEAKQIKHEDFQSLNIAQLLTQQRRNGLGNLIETIRQKVYVL